jgi:hypothetical protein
MATYKHRRTAKAAALKQQARESPPPPRKDTKMKAEVARWGRNFKGRKAERSVSALEPVGHRSRVFRQNWKCRVRALMSGISERIPMERTAESLLRNTKWPCCGIPRRAHAAFDLCDKHKLHPTLFYQWQTAFFRGVRWQACSSGCPLARHCGGCVRGYKEPASGRLHVPQSRGVVF